MVLSDEDLCKIECDGFFLVDQVDLSIGSYYYKFAGSGEVFRELLGSKVFKMVGIKCAEYEYLPQKKCLMSKDLNNEQIMYTPSSFGMKGVTLYDVYMGIERGRFNNSDQVKLSIEIMHFIDLLFSNIDRHVTNFGFYLDEDNNAELVLLDNGCFLSHYDIATRPLAYNLGGIGSMQFMSISKKDEANEFIKRLSPEMRELVPMYLELFTPERVEVMINMIEKEIKMEFPDKKYNMRKYRKNYNMVSNLVKGKKESFVKRFIK
jgi:hypothetical protein